MSLKKHQIIAIVILILLIPIGFYAKFYSGIAYQWVNNKLGGIFYELFWILIFYILLVDVKPIKIVTGVFIVTCLFEFVQLLDNGFMEIIRSNFIGQTIFGNTFSWSDFPYYFIGSLLGFIVLKLLDRLK